MGRPITSKQIYAQEAKKDLVKTHVGADGQEIAHAVVISHKTSPLVYKDDYNKNVLGQGPSNPAIAFPEKDRLKKIHDKTSKQNYEKKKAVVKTNPLKNIRTMLQLNPYSAVQKKNAELTT